MRAPLLLTISGTEVRIHPSWLVMVVGTSVLAARGAGSAAAGWALATTGLLLASVLHMELGRRLALFASGIGAREVLLTPLGGVWRLSRSPDGPAAIMALCFGGIPGSVALVASVEVALQVRGIAVPSLDHFRGQLLGELFWMNVALVAVQLLPVFPLGLGRFLAHRAALRQRSTMALVKAAMIGRGIGIVVAIGGLLAGGGVAIFGLLLWLYARAEERVHQYGAARITGRFGQEY